MWKGELGGEASGSPAASQNKEPNNFIFIQAGNRKVFKKIEREKINGEESFSIPMWPKDDIPLYKKLIIFTKPRVLPIGTGQGFVVLLSGLPYLPD